MQLPLSATAAVMTMISTTIGRMVVVAVVVAVVGLGLVGVAGLAAGVAGLAAGVAGLAVGVALRSE